VTQWSRAAASHTIAFLVRMSSSRSQLRSPDNDRFPSKFPNEHTERILSHGAKLANDFAESGANDPATMSNCSLRVVLYPGRDDSTPARNQRAALTTYANAMGWKVVAIFTDGDDSDVAGVQRLRDGAAAREFDLVLCWRTTDLEEAESLIEALSAYGIELLPLAQS